MTISRLQNKPDEDAKAFDKLVNAWDSASRGAKEKFTKQKRPDLMEYLNKVA